MSCGSDESDGATEAAPPASRHTSDGAAGPEVDAGFGGESAIGDGASDARFSGEAGFERATDCLRRRPLDAEASASRSSALISSAAASSTFFAAMAASRSLSLASNAMVAASFSGFESCPRRALLWLGKAALSSRAAICSRSRLFTDDPPPCFLAACLS